MSNILARSPFIVSVNEAGQTGSKVELFIWSGSGGAPASPQYILTKLIPASNNILMTFNISPYIREFLSFPSFPNNYNVNSQIAPTTAWVNVKVKRYKVVGVTPTLLDTTTYKGLDGYSFYASGSNVNGSDYLLEKGDYNYHYDSGATLSSQILKRAGQFTFLAVNGWSVKYSEIGTANTNTVNLTGFLVSRFQDIFKVHTSYYAKGNKVEIINASNVVQWTSYFYPIEECKYTPVVIDFINRFGAWQREFFFKAKKDAFTMENNEYNLMQTNLVTYSVLEGQRRVFNTNGKETIKVNTGWVDESFGATIKEIMLSERMLINNRPATINTKSMDIQNHIDTKMINYQLDFNFAHDSINSVV